MSRLLLLAAVTAGAFACYSAAKAAEFKQDGLTMTMTGLIEHGDALKLHRAVRGPPPAVLVLDSRGGYINDAVEIADWLRQAQTVTEVRGQCLSACVIVFAAGIQRWIGPGARLAVHQAGYEAREASPTITRALVGIYERLRIPKRIIERMLATPFDSMSDLTPDDLRAWNVKPKA